MFQDNNNTTFASNVCHYQNGINVRMSDSKEYEQTLLEHNLEHKAINIVDLKKVHVKGILKPLKKNINNI